MAKVKYENIMQNWDAHIPGMGTKIEDFYNTLMEEWNNKQTGLETDWENVGGLFGKKKRMMKIKWDRYRCYIGAESFGTDLCCTWQLYDPKASFLGMATDNSSDNRASGLFKSDFNEINEVKAFAAVCLDCAQKAVDKICEDNNLDKSKIKKQSSGALGPL